MRSIVTSRLDLVPATYEHCVAEIEDIDRFAAMLHVRVPVDWPPPLNDEQSQQFFLVFLRDHPDLVGWCVWYIVLREGGVRTLIGNAGFKGAPLDGAVEMGYSIVPAYQRRGYGSEAIDALVRWAFEDRRVRRVIAETYPDNAGSIGVLQKIGFAQCDGASEPGVIRFERFRT